MNKFSSMFGQVLQIFSKKELYSAVKETKAEKGAKGFSSWCQFVAMLFCQLGQAHSLRDICGGLASCMGKLKHLFIELHLVVQPSPMPMRRDHGDSMKQSSISYKDRW